METRLEVCFFSLFFGLASLRGSGINGNRKGGFSTGYRNTSLPSGEVELMETHAKPRHPTPEIKENSLPSGEVELMETGRAVSVRDTETPRFPPGKWN